MGCGSSAAGPYKAEHKELETSSTADCKQEVGVNVKQDVEVPALPSVSKSSLSAACDKKFMPSLKLVGEEQINAKPKFEFKPGALSAEEVRGIQNFADQHLGLDQSSAYFMRRKKAIAFVFVLHGRVYSMEQNYFVQNESYNDFSGGIRRPFAKISDHFLQRELHGVVLRFAVYNEVPDKAIMLIQIQTSEVDANEDGEFRRQLSITGQGIHTDGHEKAMLACVRRKNVTGAENRYFSDLDGNQPLCEPRVLQEGDISFFTDNELYHYVSPAGPADPKESMARTMLLMHYPAEEVLVGTTNPLNTGGTRQSETKLREEIWDALSYVKQLPELLGQSSEACALSAEK